MVHPNLMKVGRTRVVYCMLASKQFSRLLLTVTNLPGQNGASGQTCPARMVHLVDKTDWRLCTVHPFWCITSRVHTNTTLSGIPALQEWFIWKIHQISGSQWRAACSENQVYTCSPQNYSLSHCKAFTLIL